MQRIAKLKLAAGRGSFWPCSVTIGLTIQDLWEELTQRGPKWRKKVFEAVSMLDVVTGSTVARKKLESIVGGNALTDAYARRR